MLAYSLSLTTRSKKRDSKFLIPYAQNLKCFGLH